MSQYIDGPHVLPTDWTQKYQRLEAANPVVKDIIREGLALKPEVQLQMLVVRLVEMLEAGPNPR